MFRRASAATTAFPDATPLLSLVLRWKCWAFVLLLSGLFVCLPGRGHAAGLDCPEIGPGAQLLIFSPTFR